MPYPYSYDYEEKPRTRPELATNRKMWKLMLFSILTLGVYAIIFFIPFSYDLDRVAPKKDRTRTMNYLVAFFLSFITSGIVLLCWHYHIAARVEEALEQNGIEYKFGTGTYWGWFFFGSLILVGPFLYFHKLCTAMNLLCKQYNEETTATATVAAKS